MSDIGRILAGEDVRTILLEASVYSGLSAGYRVLVTAKNSAEYKEVDKALTDHGRSDVMIDFQRMPAKTFHVFVKAKNKEDAKQIVRGILKRKKIKITD